MGEEALLLGAGGAAVNFLGSALTRDMNRRDIDYMQEKYLSPQAQVRNMAAAGLNPAVVFGNHAPQLLQGGELAANTPVLGTQSLGDIAALVQSAETAKNVGEDTKAKQFANELFDRTMNDQIKQAAANLRLTNEQISKVQQEYWNIIGQSNLLEKENKLKEIDLEKHRDLIDSQLREYKDKHNLDDQQFSALSKQLPVILSKLKAEERVLSVDADIQESYKSTMTRMGIAGDAIKIIANILKILK